MDYLIYKTTQQARAERIAQAERAALAARVRKANRRGGHGCWRPFRALMAWGAAQVAWMRREWQP